MSILNKETFKEVQPRELPLFETFGTQTAVENISFQQCRPISSLSGSGPIDFNVSGQNGMEYLDTRRSRLHAKVRIERSDGTVLSPEEKVGPVNFFHALYSQVDVFLWGKLVSSNR